MDPIILAWLTTAIGVFATILVAVIIFILQRTKKTISFIVKTDTPVVSIRDEMKDRISILLDNVEATDLRLMELTVRNDGNTPIKSTDYERPVSFVFNEKTKILSRDVVAKIPDNLDPNIVIIADNAIRMEPILLNKGEWFTIKLLLTGPQSNIQTDVRIAGVETITEKRLDAAIKPRGISINMDNPWMALLVSVLAGVIVATVVNFIAR